MRAAALALLWFALGGARPAAAQFDDKPPVLHRPNPADSEPQKSAKKKSSKDADIDVDAKGVIRNIDKRLITIQADDTRIITCNILSTTDFEGPSGKVALEDIEAGMRVHLQAKATNDGEELNATLVDVSNPSDKPADGKTATIEKPSIEKTPEDEDRPVLHRGKPAKRKSSDEDDEEEAKAQPASVGEKPPSEDKPSSEEKSEREPSPAAALIEKARPANAEFIAHLPNFVCQQVTTRYERSDKISGWQAKDIVTATVTFVNGKENYEDIHVGSRKVNKEMMDIKGQRSTGEFGSVLDGLMDPRVQAEFTFLKDTEIRRISANVYDYKVLRGNSQWQVRMGGQTIFPGYSGRIWVARDTARVLRIEMKAVDIPESFPNDVLEQTVDYDYVFIGGHKALVPTESENLGCQRGAPFCSRNVIEFRDYKEFRGDATIDYNK